jgi:hypothetical protein
VLAHDSYQAFPRAPHAGAAPAEEPGKPAVQANAPPGDHRLCLRVGLALCGTLSISAREQRADPLIDFSLNQTAATGGRLKLNGDALVFGAQVPQLVDSIHIERRACPSIDEIGDHAIDPAKERMLCQSAQFRQRLG